MATVEMYYRIGCPYCLRAEKLLKERGVTDIQKTGVDTNREALAQMIERSGGRKTAPQIFINGQHIGGCDDLFALDAKGGLAPLLAS